MMLMTSSVRFLKNFLYFCATLVVFYSLFYFLMMNLNPGERHPASDDEQKKFQDFIHAKTLEKCKSDWEQLCKEFYGYSAVTCLKEAKTDLKDKRCIEFIQTK